MTPLSHTRERESKAYPTGLRHGSLWSGSPKILPLLLIQVFPVVGRRWRLHHENSFQDGREHGSRIETRRRNTLYHLLWWNYATAWPFSVMSSIDVRMPRSLYTDESTWRFLQVSRYECTKRSRPLIRFSRIFLMATFHTNLKPIIQMASSSISLTSDIPLERHIFAHLKAMGRRCVIRRGAPNQSKRGCILNRTDCAYHPPKFQSFAALGAPNVSVSSNRPEEWSIRLFAPSALVGYYTVYAADSRSNGAWCCISGAQ